MLTIQKTTALEAPVEYIETQSGPRKKVKIVNKLSMTVNNIKALSPGELVERTYTLQKQAAQTFFELGAVLYRIQSEEHHASKGSFKDWVESETDLGFSTASALIQVYRFIVEIGVQAKSADFDQIAWTKWRLLTRVMNAENAEYWLPLARNTSRKDLKQRILAALKSAQPTDAVVANDSPKKKPTPLSAATTPLACAALSSAEEQISSVLATLQSLAGGLDAVRRQSLSLEISKILNAKE